MTWYCHTVKIPCISHGSLIASLESSATVSVTDFTMVMLQRHPDHAAKNSSGKFLVRMADLVELGFTEEPTIGDILQLSRLRPLGIRICPRGFGPRVRLKYLSQPSGRIYVAMRPLIGMDKIPRVFRLDGGQPPWLRSEEAPPKKRFPLESVWLFICT